MKARLQNSKGISHSFQETIGGKNTATAAHPLLGVSKRPPDCPHGIQPGADTQVHSIHKPNSHMHILDI